ncbi:MAG: hypothetical protein GY847_13700 [Proteobacteria bacterium]|nr:hypothetical protein [Pseudomonadota bacterium]
MVKKRSSLINRFGFALGALLLFAAIGTPARALDSYQDRRGFFLGMGLGGGGAFQGGDPGGAILLDFQLGGGATKNLTLDMDVDLWFHLMDTHKNLLITPGPEINYFIGDTGIFVRGGIGMALTTTWIDATDNTDFNIGFDGSLGFGWEFFAESDLAVGLAVESDYIVLKDNDIISVGFAVSLKHY